jgi:hypothetical protein
MLSPAFYVVLGYTAAGLLLGWAYFRRYQLTRPPLGVMNLGDVALMIGGIILVPYLYLALPLWLAAGLFGLGALSILYCLWEPILRARWAVWLIMLLSLAADVVTALHLGTRSALFFAVNNAVLILIVVGVTNLWAQSGAKARDISVLAGLLALYDFLATAHTALTTNLLARLTTLPLAPLVAWGAGRDQLGIGLGDLLMATVFPLVIRKGFGRTAGIAALATMLGLLGVMQAAVTLGGVAVTVPAMTVLGPLMVLQYVFWRRRLGPERTTWQYLQAEPLAHIVHDSGV